MLSNNGKNVSVKTIDFSKAKKEFSIETTEPKVNDTNIGLYIKTKGLHIHDEEVARGPQMCCKLW